jgi:hypothetical protein
MISRHGSPKQRDAIVVSDEGAKLPIYNTGVRQQATPYIKDKG